MIHAYNRKRVANVNSGKMSSPIQLQNLYTSGGQNESDNKGLMLYSFARSIYVSVLFSKKFSTLASSGFLRL